MKAFVAGLLKEADGKPSWSRLAATLVVTATVGWVTYVVLREGHLPDLTSTSLFLGSGVGSTYGSNKIAGVISDNKQQ